MKQLINIRVRDYESHIIRATKLVSIEASLVKGHKYEPEIRLMLHKAYAYDSGWVVTEYTTGFAFTRGDLRKDALAKLNDLPITKPEALRTIEACVNRHGLANN